jgi:hypothetical protein
MPQTMVWRAEKNLAHLQELINKGTSFTQLRSHPGKTSDFIQWREDGITALHEFCGDGHPLYLEANIISFFPEWYAEGTHGPFQSGEEIRVLTPSEEQDAKTAFRIFQEGIKLLTAKLTAAYRLLSSQGRIEKISSKQPRAPLFQQSLHQEGARIGDINQNQSQSQQTTIELKFLIQHATDVVEQTLDNEEDIQNAKNILAELQKEAEEKKPKWATAKKAASMFLSFGRDAFIALLPVLLQTYGVLPPGISQT